MTSFTRPLKIFLSPDSRIVTWPLIDRSDSIVPFRGRANTLLDLLGAQLDQIIALDWSTYPIKVVKRVAFCPDGSSGALQGLREAGAYLPLHRQSRPHHTLQAEDYSPFIWLRPPAARRRLSAQICLVGTSERYGFVKLFPSFCTLVVYRFSCIYMLNL